MSFPVIRLVITKIQQPEEENLTVAIPKINLVLCVFVCGSFGLFARELSFLTLFAVLYARRKF